MSRHRSLWLEARLLVLLAAMLLGPRLAIAEGSSVDAMTRALLEGTEGSRIAAATRLYHRGRVDAALEALAPRLRVDDPDERCLAARLLGVLRSERAIAALTASLDDEDWAVRRDVVEALGQIGSNRAAPALERRLGDAVPRVRIAAARALGEVGRTASLPARLAVEPEPEVRMHLVETLGRSPGPASTRALVAALEDDLESVRLLAAGFAVERGRREAAALLADRLARGQGSTARREAATALGRATVGARGPALEALAEALGDGDTEVGLAAAAALVMLDDPRGVAHLRRVARESRDPAHRARAITLLERPNEGDR